MESNIKEKKHGKRKMEKQLVLMRTNSERMRKIMHRYLGSAETHGVLGRAPSDLKEISEDEYFSESPVPTPTDSEDLSDYFLEDGNEADVDSTGPYDSVEFPRNQTYVKSSMKRRGKETDLNQYETGNKTKQRVETGANSRHRTSKLPQLKSRDTSTPK